MQRRAVAVYVAFFLVLGAASYSLIATAEEPTITIENPEHQLEEGEEFTVDGQTYTVTSIESSTEGGDHGEPEETVYTANVEWTETDVELNETWENESTIEYRDGEWQVLIEGGEEPSAFTLQEVIDRQAILENDSNARNETVESDGQEYVVVETAEGENFVPAEEYFPQPQTESYSQGDTLQYNNNTVTVEEITADGVTVAWTGDRTDSQELENEETVTLNGQEFFILFPGEGTVQLLQDTSSYEAQTQEIQQYQDRVSGLWYVTVLAGAIVFFLIALAFMPSRY